MFIKFWDLILIWNTFFVKIFLMPFLSKGLRTCSLLLIYSLVLLWLEITQNAIILSEFAELDLRPSMCLFVIFINTVSNKDTYLAVTGHGCVLRNHISKPDLQFSLRIIPESSLWMCSVSFCVWMLLNRFVSYLIDHINS